MLPAAVAVTRAGLDLDTGPYEGVSFEVMGPAMEKVLGSRAEAITLGPRIFVAPGVFDAVVVGTRPDLVAHELRHVDQWRRDGARFLLSYVAEYVRYRMLGLSHDAAYLAISYEIDAYAAGAPHEEPRA